MIWRKSGSEPQLYQFDRARRKIAGAGYFYSDSQRAGSHGRYAARGRSGGTPCEKPGAL